MCAMQTQTGGPVGAVVYLTMMAFSVACILAACTVAEPAPDCHTLTETECENYWEDCAWHHMCEECEPIPCDWHIEEAKCNNAMCSWNSTLDVCYNITIPCYSRPTETTCLDAVPDCAWDSDANACLSAVDFCSFLFDPVECEAADICTTVDGICHANHIPPVCNIITDAEACVVQEHCVWEWFVQSCHEKGDTEFCYNIGFSEPICDYYPECSYDASFGCVPYNMCGKPEKLEVMLFYIMTMNNAYQDYIASGIIPPSEEHGPNATILGSGISHNDSGLIFENACIRFPPFDGATFSHGCTLSMFIYSFIYLFVCLIDYMCAMLYRPPR